MTVEREYESEQNEETSPSSVTCKHDGKKRTETTKSGVHEVCDLCGKRLGRLDVVEKVVVPGVIEK